LHVIAGWHYLSQNEIIQTEHRLAAACKKHKGIVFTDKNKNIIQVNSLDKEDMNGSDSTGASDHNNSEIT